MVLKDGQAPYDLAEVQFFNQYDTLAAVKRLADSENLAIFCGAGLTIDRTGQSWGALVSRLLTDRGKIPPGDVSDQDAQNVCAILEPLHVASVVSHYLRENADDDGKMESALHTSLQSHLYPLSDWAAGRLVDNVIRLAIARARKHLAITLITTNYDTSLEEQFRNQREEERARIASDVPFPFLFVRVVGAPVAPRLDIEGTKGCGAVKLIYLHGRVPREGDVVGKVAFSEQNYLSTRSVVERKLGSVFAKNDLLILGSSLSDPPLMHALLASQGEARDNSCSRFALLPMPSVPNQGVTMTRSQGVAVAEHLPARMAEFGVRLLMPDYFSQVSQFVEEIRVHTSTSRTEDEYAKRLESWWDAWNSGRDEFDYRRECHEALQVAVDAIRGELGYGHRSSSRSLESLKLEIWARVPKGPRRRSLELWASSAGVVIDTSNPRWASLSLVSEFSAVRAYQGGQPLLTAEPHSTPDTIVGPKRIRLVVKRMQDLGELYLAPIQPREVGGETASTPDESGENV